MIENQGKMVRVISQETFDSVVKENMDEFGLEKEEAIKEAISQFESQVCVSQIVPDHQVVKCRILNSYKN